MNQQPDFTKQFVSLKYYLLGRKYFTALRALNLAKSHHTGLRKDGVTPEFHHQIGIASYITTLKDVSNEEAAIVAALLHDIVEDHNVPLSSLELEFGKGMTNIIELLTKKKGPVMNMEEYYFRIGDDSIASIVKGADRINNVQSMQSAFSPTKQIAYVSEVKIYFLPMLKRAKYKFPEQSSAYFNIIHMLKSQIELVDAIHKQNETSTNK